MAGGVWGAQNLDGSCARSLYILGSGSPFGGSIKRSSMDSIVDDLLSHKVY